MKKRNKIIAAGIAITVVILFYLSSVSMVADNKEGTTIQEGVLTYSEGHYLSGTPLALGYDSYGYNYQAHMYVGSYANIYLGRLGFPPYEGNDLDYIAENPDVVYTWVWPYRDIRVMMQWNDVWLSNQDCDKDGLLDRHYGHTSYDGSGAWLTNHMWGVNRDNTNWEYFVKIITPSTEAGDYVDEPYDGEGNGCWYRSDGTLIGKQIWVAFAIVQQISNDPSIDEHGLIYNGDIALGFGIY